MPMLKIFRHEAFAQARARGARAREAYEKAGYAGVDARGPRRVDSLPTVIERIAELRAGAALSEAHDFGPLVDELADLARAAVAVDTGPAWTAARALLADAAQLKMHMDEQAPAGGSAFEEGPGVLTSEEWIARYASGD